MKGVRNMARPRKQERKYVTDDDDIMDKEELAEDISGHCTDGDVVDVYEVVRKFSVKVEISRHVKAVDTKTKEVIFDEKVDGDC